MNRYLYLSLISFTLTALYGQDVYPYGPRGSKNIALTVDDGWDPDWELVEFLIEEDVPFTAIVPAVVANVRPEWVQALAEAGIPVGNHGYTHHWLTPMTEEEIRSELQRTKDLLFELTGEFCPYFRPSGGKYDDRILSIAAEMGYHTLLWDNDVHGYVENPDPDDQLEYLMNHLQGGNIILSHFGTRLNTQIVLSRFIPLARQRGYRFVSLDELFAGEF
ncbi:MAG: polysaccharide deacetylase family protein [Spirochaetaceae bacterium]|jgi:peptidoglycan/xylan/chitin deacetylase (PgdA/CDA1 family)|nr:polysaccharide deacetylase family protein [Spirochaetaceae bacterium]